MTSPTTSTGRGRPAPAAPRAVPELAGAREVWPRGARLRAIREAAGAFKERFVHQGTATAVLTVALASAPYPARYALGGAARAINPYVSIINRLVVVATTTSTGCPACWPGSQPPPTVSVPRSGGAVVTGAARGLGLQIAQALAARGLAVQVTDVDADARAGTLAVWVNNAGVLRTGTAWSHTDEQRRLVLAVNVGGTVNGTVAALG